MNLTHLELTLITTRLHQVLCAGGAFNPHASLQPVSLSRYIREALDPDNRILTLTEFRQKVLAHDTDPH